MTNGHELGVSKEAISLSLLLLLLLLINPLFFYWNAVIKTCFKEKLKGKLNKMQLRSRRVSLALKLSFHSHSRQRGNTGSLLTMNVTIPWLLKVFCKAALMRSKMDSRFGLIKSCASIFLISKKTTGSLVRRSRWSVGARKRKWYKI